MISMTVTGVPQAQARIGQLIGTLAVTVSPSEDAGGEILEQAVLQLVPVDKGDLRDSVHRDGGEVTADEDHGRFQEFGTSVMAAQPFMRPAADENEDVVVAAVAAIFRGALAAFA